MNGESQNRRRRQRRKENKRKRKLYEKVMCQKDYLTSICLFLTLKDTIKLIPNISFWHYEYICGSSQKRLLQTLLLYEGCKWDISCCNGILQLFDSSRAKQLHVVFSLYCIQEGLAKIQKSIKELKKINYRDSKFMIDRL